MFQLGVIDQQALLDAAEYPNKEEVLKRMDMAKQQQMEMMMKMKQAEMGVDMQKEQMKSQTDIQTTDMDVKGKIAVEGMKVMHRHDEYIRGRGGAKR
jgi:Mg/Co/Ni transporter MgtE